MKHNQFWKTKHTSIMHDTNDNKFIPEINLLYVDYGVSSEKLALPCLSHNFWQMEFILEGTILAHVGKSQMVLTEKQIIIIPPGFKHKFTYNGARKTWSFKFNLSPEFIDNLQVLVLPDSNDAVQTLCTVFFQLLAEYQQIPISLYTTLEYLIGGVMTMSYAKIEDEKNMPKWAIAAKEFIATNIEENINLEDLAKHLNYTRIHLSRLCKMHFNIKLKDFFDQEKVSIIKKKLLYSHKNITEIAQETGFNDVYSFSRFYKRVTTLTPSEQRNSPENE
jgi:AraC-like DNA-binding protein